MSDHRRHVLLAYGGRSAEHAISIRSARTVLEGLVGAGHRVSLLAVAPDGTLRTGPTSADLATVVDEGRPVTRLDAFDVDVVFPVLHGPFGEDGTIQGMCAFLGVPCVGASVLASAVCMDKVAFKALLAGACPEVAVAPWVAVDAGDLDEGRTRVLEALDLPVFVKPANMGSSIGISRVDDPAWLGPALEAAAAYDRRILVERAVHRPREIEIAVLGNGGPDTVVSAPGEIVLPPDTWYDYDTKYVDDVAEYRIPTTLDPELSARLRAAALAAYRATGCTGMARVDFLVDGRTGVPYLNEINTIPGFTSISMYPKLMAHAGITLEELVDRLCTLAVEAGRMRPAPVR